MHLLTISCFRYSSNCPNVLFMSFGWILILLDEYYMCKSTVRDSAPFDHLMACLNNTKAIANLVCLYK